MQSPGIRYDFQLGSAAVDVSVRLTKFPKLSRLIPGPYHRIPHSTQALIGPAILHGGSCKAGTLLAENKLQCAPGFRRRQSTRLISSGGVLRLSARHAISSLLQHLRMPLV
eukprot:5962310-Pleurochrysis_carterae.AAC.5